MDWSTVFDPAWTVSLMPSNATEWARVMEALDADLVARDPVGLIAAARSVSRAPSQWLPHLAEERSVDEFSSAWPEDRRRNAVAVAFPLHRVKGTRPSVRKALEPLGFETRIVEWFEVSPRRQQNTFRVAVNVSPDREWVRGRAEIIRIANMAKNAHTKLEALEVSRLTNPNMTYVGAYARRDRTMLIAQQPDIGELHLHSTAWVGAGMIRVRTVIIGPRP